MIKKSRVSYSCFAVITGVVICTVLVMMPFKSWGLDQFEQKARFVEAQDLDKSVVHLYFSDKKNSFLIAEAWNLGHSDNPVEFGKIIVEALANGPRTGFMRTIPEGTTLNAFFVTRDGTAYVDMSDKIRQAHPGGIKSELFIIYSIVNSLILNIPEIDAVRF
ncbi:MAG: GerMN domain-containing protein [Desulfobacteraceae bacterium]|nr:GerMN domain-containing protein [Desulfobacteraceae bacterium]